MQIEKMQHITKDANKKQKCCQNGKDKPNGGRRRRKKTRNKLKIQPTVGGQFDTRKI